MRPIFSPDELEDKVLEGRREAAAAFGNGEGFLERLVQRARHVEVQILGDHHGQIVHLYERDCSVQRRNQKVVERAPDPYLSEAQRGNLRARPQDLSLRQYQCAGTVEFLMDADTGEFFFIEVNPRVQVEHTVTEEVTGIDIVKAQIRITEGGRIGELAETGVPSQEDITLSGHAIQCRVTTEDPLNNFIPDYGRITAYRGATGFGIRLDGGTAYSGAVITRFVASWKRSPPGRQRRTASTAPAVPHRRDDQPGLVELLSHPSSRRDLHHQVHRRDQGAVRLRPAATGRQLLNYIGDITVNGHPEAAGRQTPRPRQAAAPPANRADAPARHQALLEEQGAQAVADWMLAQKKLLMTDPDARRPSVAARHPDAQP